MPRLEATLRPKRALRCSTPTLGAVPQTRTPAPPPTRPRAADLKRGAGVHKLRAQGGLSDSSESAQHACERSFIHTAAVVCTKDPDAPVGGRVRMGECGQFSYGFTVLFERFADREASPAHAHARAPRGGSVRPFVANGPFVPAFPHRTAQGEVEGRHRGPRTHPCICTSLVRVYGGYSF